jgi:hypothetical protein
LSEKRDFSTFSTLKLSKIFRVRSLVLIGLFFCVQTKAQFDFGNSQSASQTNKATPTTNTFVPKYDNESINHVISVVHQVEESQNFVNLGNLSPDSNVALPFGIIKDVGAVRYVIAVDSMKFKSTGAYFSAFAAIEFPGTSKRIAFRGSGIKFNPSGVIGGEQARLYLASSHTIQINPTVRLRLLDNGENWVEWDCNGFKAINLVGNFEFSKSKIRPDSTVNNDTVVKASFSIYTQNIHDFVTMVNIKPFCITGLKGWSFRVDQAAVDMSELVNPPGFGFPQGYPVQNLATPQSWMGFSLKSLTIKLPREISKTGKKTEIIASNMMIDNMGFTGNLQVNNLFNSSEGSMSGWAFSIDELGAGFITNRLTSGHLKGGVNIPIMGESQTLQYTADINHSYATGQTNYNFLVNPANNISFNVFSAKASLNNNSSINVFVQNGNFKPSANLCGFINFDGQKVNSNGGKLTFQNLTLITDAPYITNGIFSLGNIGGGQMKAHNYPININEITLGINQGAPVLGFSVTLNLSEQAGNSLSVGTGVLLKGKINSNQQTYNGEYPVTHTKTKWEYDRTIITGFSIDLQTSPFTLKGSVLFKENDPVYGNGFMGTLDMSIKKIMDNPGSVSVCFGSLPDYKYFYLDAKIPVAFQLPSLPVTITRLIGGVYYHMTPNKTSEQDLIALNKNYTGASGNALSYTPTQNTSLGLKAGVSYKSSGNERPFNGDLMLEVNFTSSGGLGTINLSGDVYSMVTISQRSKAPVIGKMSITYDAPNKIFDALAQININAYNMITGTGLLKVHFDPQIWYVCVGKPSAPNNIKFLNLANVPSYFMVGNSIEPPMPPPAQILQNPSVAAVLGNRNTQQLQSASGFCAGSRITSSLNRTFGFSFFNVSGSFNFDLGFDMMMANYGENAHCQGSDEKIGMNGWLAEGNMYLAMNGGVTINGSFKFPSNCPQRYETHLICGKKHCCCVGVTIPCLIDGGFSYNVFSAGVSAVVSAKGPKPVYFAGAVNCNYNIFDKINGNFNYDFSYGTNCTPVSN